MYHLVFEGVHNTTVNIHYMNIKQHKNNNKTGHTKKNTQQTISRIAATSDTYQITRLRSKRSTTTDHQLRSIIMLMLMIVINIYIVISIYIYM